MKKLVFALLLLSVASPAHAATHCYSPEQMNAERLLRLHSELMVITVTCKQSSVGRDLVRAYTGFTRRNVSAIKKAEQTLSQYYAENYGGDGLSHVDKIRTKLANAFGQQIADESAPAFCAQRRDMVTSMYDSQPISLRDTSLRLYGDEGSFEEPCSPSQTVADGMQTDEEPPVKPKKIKKKAKS